MKKLTLSLLLILITSTISFAGEEQTAAASIQASRLASHVKFLANDLLEGRGTGTRGYDIAALYVATQFESLGLTAGGKNGAYLQPVPFRRSLSDATNCSLRILNGDKQEELKYEEDFMMPPDFLRGETSVTAPVVFAGFGVTAPAMKYDDYEGIDVKDKIVILFSGAPASFPTSERAHYSNALVKDQNAVAHGAIGILTVRTPEDEKRGPWDRTVRRYKMASYRWKEPDGTPNKVFAQVRGTATLTRNAAAKLFEGSPVSLEETFAMIEKKNLHGFALARTLSMKKTSQMEEAESPNVIGILEGSDPQLKSQYVVYSAHLDHLGISEPVKGDRINNGAYDNGTGIAALIEIARAFTMLPTRPKRSILFIAVTGEEMGLQGSDYFANYPTVPAQSLVADINMDMLMMLYPFTDVVILGAEHSSLGPIASEAAASVGLKATPDPAPEEVRFVRSDQYSFIKKGVPSIFMISGFQSADPSINGEKATREWLLTTYHSPQDEAGQKMYWDAGIKAFQASFLTGYQVSNAAKVPEWNAGDFFGVMFGKAKSAP